MTERQRRTYLDYNASAPLLAEARAALVDALSLEGNPSSVHAEGRRARQVVEAARRVVADLVGGAAENVVFTSGASEAASTCLVPTWISQGRELSVGRLAVLDTDHPSVRDGGRFDPTCMTRLAVDRDGVIDLRALTAWLDALPANEHAMLALTLANSETGVLQPIEAIAEAISGRKLVLVVDAVQAAGRYPLEIGSLNADAVILSGHKIGAAKGIGAFVLRDTGMQPMPLVTGGGQEKRRRAGTEAVPAIASFGAAARVAAVRSREPERLLALRDRLERGLAALGAGFRIAGGSAPRLPNTAMVACDGFRAETAQIALDLAGFAVSAGSACSSGKVGPSHVLAAMHRAGAELDPNHGAIRISFGYETTADEIDAVVAELGRLARRAGGSERAAA